MSATTLTPIRPMIPIRREGRRPGAVHAAFVGARPGEWSTACGETLTDGPRGTIVRLSLEFAHELIGADSPLICLRCARVGDAIGGRE